jgi:hypothetical protein
MIKRHYFASFKKYHDDGRGSFSWRYFTITRTSWFRDDLVAFKAAVKMAEADLIDRPGAGVHCIAFTPF